GQDYTGDVSSSSRTSSIKIKGANEMEKEHKREKSNHIIWKYIMLIIGATFAAIAIELFLVPNAIIDGGIIGVSLLLNNLTGINFGDRKSTRLNSSHVSISYAVF